MLMGSPADLMAFATSFRPLPVTTETTVAPFSIRPCSQAFLTAAVPVTPAGSPKTPQVRAQQLLRGENFLVGHVDSDAVGLADGHEGLIGVARHADGDGVGDGVLLHRLPGLVLLRWRG